MEGSVNKSIVHPQIEWCYVYSFVYWLVAISEKPILFPAIEIPYFRSAKTNVYQATAKKFSNILMWFIQATSSVLNH